MSPAGEELAQTIAAKLPHEATAFAVRIEQIRSEMAASNEMLGAWDRPWLASSPELQERLGLKHSDDRFETTISVKEACKASKPAAWCRALLAIVLKNKPRMIVEMGTNVGMSGLYLGAGLALNGFGRLITMEGAPSKAALASRHFERLNVPAKCVIGGFEDTLAGVLEEAKPIDLAFIDGFHEHSATVKYHEAFNRAAAPGAVLVYDDINWSDGMRAAWRTISNDPEIRFALDYGSIGICGLA
jgi:predicted O-methyltransferase YrrM